MKRGFTLVELLAVIALIGILITISIPAYNNIKKKAAERTLENKIDMLEVAAYNYGNDNINAVKSTPEDYVDVTIAELIEAGYVTSESDDGNLLINPVTGLSMSDTLTISYEDYRIKVVVNGGLTGLNLTVLTDGGSWDGTTPIKLASGATTTINSPTKNHYIFTGWTVTGEGSSILGTTFTMGTKSTVITAKWQAIYSCTLAATIESYTCSAGDLSGTKCNVGAATPSMAYYSTWDSGWICNASTEAECWSSCVGVSITCSGNPTKTVDRAIDVSIDNGHECHCTLAGSCTVTWVCSTGTPTGDLCFIDAIPSSYYCPNGGELSGTNCYLYNQTSCPSGWTSS